jgi:hypothetical protein
MGSGRLLRCIGAGGAALAIALLWVTPVLPWAAGDGIVTGYGFGREFGEPGRLADMLYLCYRYVSGYLALPMVLGTALALTAGVRSRPGRWTVGVLALLTTITAAVIDVITLFSTRSRAHAAATALGYPSMVIEILCYLLAVAAAVALVAGRWKLYGGYAVVMLVALAGLHAGSLLDYRATTGSGVPRVELAAWLPTVWYLCAAAGAALALTGSAARANPARRARHARTAWQDRGPWQDRSPLTPAPVSGTSVRTGRFPT